MNVELRPHRLEIDVELRPAAHRKRCRTGAIPGGKPDPILRLDSTGPPRYHDHPFRHGDRPADIVGPEYDSFASAPQHTSHLLGERNTCLGVERGEGLVKQHDVR